MSIKHAWLLLVPLACGRTAAPHPTPGAASGGSADGGSESAAGAGASSPGGQADASAVGGEMAAAGVGGAAPAMAGSADQPLESAGAGGEAPDSADPPRCAHLGEQRCGAAPVNCCASLQVPAGAFTRYSGGPAGVSSFRLDKFEVTVGRFRAFVEAYPGSRPAPGSGKNAHDLEDPGWVLAWDEKLPATREQLDAELKCDASLATWTAAPGDNELRPINCMTWYEAAAFCIWDGGRLPSDIEWEYTVRGGDEERKLPWNTLEPSPRAFANYRNYCETDPQGLRPECVGVAQIWNVGTRPPGDGRWGHSDLAGNLWELVVDYRGPGLSCSDCAQHEPYAGAGSPSTEHVTRGGGYRFDLGDGLWSRDDFQPIQPGIDVGFRCARR